jgi:hypothetical protein
MHKEYNVMCIEAEVLQAMVDKDAMPVTATAEASELSRRATLAEPPTSLVSVDMHKLMNAPTSSSCKSPQD